MLSLQWKDGTDAAPDDDQLYAVELSRGTRGFGFSIRGGREFHQMPLFVLRIADNGSAAQDGRLRVSFGLNPSVLLFSPVLILSFVSFIGRRSAD